MANLNELEPDGNPIQIGQTNNLFSNDLKRIFARWMTKKCLSYSSTKSQLKSAVGDQRTQQTTDLLTTTQNKL
jgi:hypothetical protein